MKVYFVKNLRDKSSYVIVDNLTHIYDSISANNVWKEWLKKGEQLED